MSRRLGREALAPPRADLDRALLDEGRGEPGDPPHGPEERDDRRHVVRPHVEQRTGPVAVEDVGVRMPDLLAAGEHRGRDGERLADRALVEQGAGLLVRAPEEDVGGAREAQPLRLGKLAQLVGFRGGDRQRLLGVHVLARLERSSRHRGVGSRWSEVEDDVDRVRPKQLLDRQRPERELGRDLLAPRRLEVRAGADLERVEGRRVRGIRATDHAAADDPDLCGRPHAGLPTRPVTAAYERRTASSAEPSVSSCSTSSHSTPSSRIAGRTYA